MTLPQIQGIEVHAAANIFPLMDEAAFADLVEDIRVNRQRESCSTWKGQLIDGRNRWLACQVLGIEPEVGEFEDDDFDVVKFVLSANLYRRHLTDSQRAMVGQRARGFHDEEAKERQRQQAKRNQPQSDKQKVETLPPIEKSKARDAAGAAVNVSGKLIDAAATVLEHGSKELIAKVDAGEVSVTKAAKIAKAVDKRQQIKAIEQPARKPKPERTTFTELRKVFDAMTAAERKQAAVMWEQWLDDDS